MTVNNPINPSNSEYNTQFTPIFHIFIALAITCFAWIFMLKPLLFSKFSSIFLTYSIPRLAVLFWMIIVPIVILTTGVLDSTIYGDEDALFVKLKVGSVWLGSLFKLGLVFLFFWGGFPKSGIKYKMILMAITGIFVANILEAVGEQLHNIKNPEYDITNGIMGIIIAMMVIYEIYNQINPVSISSSGEYYVKFGISIATILAYTFWNISFKSYIHQDSGIILFVLLTLVLPIILNQTRPGSWLQFRAQSLLFYAFVTFGFANNEWSMLPLYNTKGYDKIADKESIITEIQQTSWYRILLIIFTILPICYFVINRPERI
jgi:hypothetical protein